MICEKYQQLEGFNQPLFCAKVVHCIMNDDNLFTIGEEIIKLGLLKGIFDGVKIGAAEIAETPPTPSTSTIEASESFRSTNTNQNL